MKMGCCYLASNYASIPILFNIFKKLVILLILTCFATRMIFLHFTGQPFEGLIRFIGGNYQQLCWSLLATAPGIIWIHGVHKLFDEAELWLNFKFRWVWKFSIGSILPISLAIGLKYFLGEAPTYNGIPYPSIALASGWFLTTVGLMVASPYKLKKKI